MRNPEDQVHSPRGGGGGDDDDGGMFDNDAVKSNTIVYAADNSKNRQYHNHHELVVDMRTSTGVQTFMRQYCQASYADIYRVHDTQDWKLIIKQSKGPGHPGVYRDTSGFLAINFGQDKLQPVLTEVLAAGPVRKLGSSWHTSVKAKDNRTVKHVSRRRLQPTGGGGGGGGGGGRFSQRRAVLPPAIGAAFCFASTVGCSVAAGVLGFASGPAVLGVLIGLAVVALVAASASTHIARKRSPSFRSRGFRPAIAYAQPPQQDSSHRL